MERVKALCEIGQALGSIHDLDSLLQSAVVRIVDLLDVESSSVMLLDEERDELYFRVSEETRSGAEERLREIRVPAGQGVAGWVLRQGVAEIVPDVTRDERFYRGVDMRTGTKTRSLLCVPMRSMDRTIGVTSAINKQGGPFDEEDAHLLEALASQLAVAVENARLIGELHATRQRLQDENVYLREEMGQSARFETLVGDSRGMQQVYQLVERVVETSATVLVTGENGTGKELIAQVVHYNGPRVDKPFIAVNCAAIPEALMEAELFGYEKGAHSTAVRRKPGRFELAQGGTLFLDEIGEMSPALQAKLLRVLEDKRFERLGGTETIQADVRIIAATNRDLRKMIAAGEFREDLFYRLNVFPIHIPPLRERADDVLPLAMHFAEKFSAEMNKSKASITNPAAKVLKGYHWPGNVRELQNVMERAVILSGGGALTVDDLPRTLRDEPGSRELPDDRFRLPPGGLDIAELEKRLIIEALEQANHNKSRAGKMLGLSRTQLRTRMRNYGLLD